jgi:1,4-dihydroxy-2-naphthoyl-CoA synthase
MQPPEKSTVQIALYWPGSRSRRPARKAYPRYSIRHVGRSKALDWILRATHIDAATAERYGLVSAVVPGDMLLQSALDIALEIRKLGPRSVAQSKRCIYLSEDADLRTAQRFGIEALSMLVGGNEWKEGMQAFSKSARRASIRGELLPMNLVQPHPSEGVIA